MQKIFLLLSVIFLTLACSKYQKVLKSTNPDYKYEMAVKYYNNGDYYKALPLFEELINIYRGTEKGEDVYYYYAYSNYNLEDYMLAGYYFKNFTSTYPGSKRAEECLYMNAYCYYLDSPVYSLDQSNTRKAINTMQLFINMYPASSRVQKCNQLIDGLRLKLEKKSFYNARLYYNLGDYIAATMAFSNMITEFPDTRYKEEIRYLILKSNYLLAVNSIEAKKHERYQKAVESYHEYSSSYPDGKYSKESGLMYRNSIKEIHQDGNAEN